MAGRNFSPSIREGLADGGKVGKTMAEWKAGTLHSGSKTGPVVKDQRQAVAIAISQAEKAGER